MQPVVSIIIPLFNTRDYIADALDSVLRQKYGDIEIVVVDDGSTDGSVEVVQRYRDRHPGIVLLHQKHAGPGAARNRGIRYARGEYLLFLDSDDRLAEDALSGLVHAGRTNRSEIVVGMMVSFRGKRRWIPERMRFFASGFQAEATNVQQLPELIENVSPCNKLFRRTFIEEHTIRFLEDARLSEDLYFVVSAFLNAEKVSVIPQTVYYYRGRSRQEGSLTANIDPGGIADILRVSAMLDAMETARFAGEAKALRRRRHRHEMNSILYRLVQLEAQGQDVMPILKKVSSFVCGAGKDTLGEFSPARNLILYELSRQRFGEAREWLRREIPVKKSFLERLGGKTVSATKHIVWAVIRMSLRISLPLPEAERGIWLVGERQGNGADDTGYLFFRYCRRAFPERPVFFVTKNGVPDDDPEHIVRYGSWRNLRLALKAEVFAFSDGYRDILPYWPRIASMRERPFGVFLQHGVFAFKRSEYYRAPAVASRGEAYDMMVVSSEKEKRYVARDFGYPLSVMAVTGLSRFDRLYADRDRPTRRQILFVPTWRFELRYADEAAYRDSMFHRKLLAFFRHEKLHKVLEKYDYTLQVCFHHAMAPFAKLYAGTAPRIVFSDMTDTDFYEHMIQSQMLITDYSSVAFNMAYLGRPVCFYQFDRERFLAVEGGSFIDFDTELFGMSSEDPGKIAEEVEYNILNGFKVRPEHRAKADMFFAYGDGGNCRRIYKALTERLE